ncbi:FUSC family protein [Shigella flexneri]
MSLVLCVGYAIIQVTGMNHGYWILLTSLFVVNQTTTPPTSPGVRIIGTLVGIAIGLPIRGSCPL